MLKGAIVGFGFISGKGHYPAFQKRDDVEIVATADFCAPRLEKAPGRHYATWQELLEKEREPFERVLVFTRTRRGAERLSHILKARDHSVDRIHADRSQPQREAALRQFSDGRTRVLVATDIAARGLDVDSVSHVINYDVPAAPEDYVHRVGRTGRAGNHGKAITIVAPVDELSMRAIERLTGQAVKRVVPNGFAGTQTIPTSPVRAFAVAARTRSSSVRTFRPRRAR